jgi:hypothetical protein
MLTRRTTCPSPVCVTSLLSCAIGLHATASIAQETDAMSTLLVQRVSACSISFVLPPHWISRVEKTTGHCKVIAERPSPGPRCAPLDDDDDSLTQKNIYCDDDKRIVIDVQAGSVAKLAARHDVRDAPQPHLPSRERWGDFIFDEGRWTIDSGMGNYQGDSDKELGGARLEFSTHNNAVASREGNFIYAERPFRKYFEQGGYCCIDTTWEALVDLSGERFAWIEIQWGEQQENVLKFLRLLK